ncbi:DCC1-like thiol-disulfide oxidoreductase family protein [Pelagicoccus sp. SDUM812005]|uniref:thiol-disulfide oxidoreductase DCC family protein n=1 Tax=Pelagicoccus sp. SDUM812005 TaxID=3041257 RepID=UPI00280F7DFE|nr:DCC1-like thiol-disulfide oxidoreductase family protein [Pelagicoccus sp. SDUM812005]MDQ8180884.1 DCC1-like thiol-disulfide oxidoreductase family protein [Pelagicoccus sp. SDUM812005]
MAHPSKNIVFFDGVCGFCNKSVDFLLRVDGRRTLFFSPIQGETAKRILPAERRENVDTISFFDGTQLFYRTTALLKIAKALGGVWLVFYPLIVVPATWRDLAYDWVARRRYRWFGKRDACRMPSPQERARFLD